MGGCPCCGRRPALIAPAAAPARATGGAPSRTAALGPAPTRLRVIEEAPKGPRPSTGCPPGVFLAAGAVSGASQGPAGILPLGPLRGRGLRAALLGGGGGIAYGVASARAALLLGPGASGGRGTVGPRGVGGAPSRGSAEGPREGGVGLAPGPGAGRPSLGGPCGLIARRRPRRAPCVGRRGSVIIPSLAARSVGMAYVLPALERRALVGRKWARVGGPQLSPLRPRVVKVLAHGVKKVLRRVLR